MVESAALEMRYVRKGIRGSNPLVSAAEELAYRMTKRKLWACAGIIGIAAVFRLGWLTSIPPGIHPDAAANGLDAWQAATTHHHQVFYEGNFGREGLFINILSYVFQIFGPSAFALKAPGALIGLVSVLGVFFLAREVTRKTETALLASLLMAISFWMTVFDRMGLRAVLSVDCVIWTSLFFLRALRRNTWLDYALAGLFLGIGMHTYIAFRMMPVALFVGWLVSAGFARRSDHLTLWSALRKRWAFVLTVLVSVVITLPLGLYFIHHPQFFFGRANEVSVFHQPHTWKIIGESLTATLSIFTFFGDPNWRHNFSTVPILDMLQSLLFVLGLSMLWRSVRRRDITPTDARAQEKTVHVFLLMVLGLMLIPGIVTYSPGGIPHALRIINSAPVVYIIVAIAFVSVYENIRRMFASQPRAVNQGVMIVVLMLVLANGMLFVRWGYNRQVAHEYSQDVTRVAAYINQAAATGAHPVLVHGSSELDFLTLRTPGIRKVWSLDDASLRPESSMIVYAHYRSQDAEKYAQLLATGWQKADQSWGEGSHTIRVLIKRTE